jgi:tetratricopeptide (TPR) repeat protein
MMNSLSVHGKAKAFERLNRHEEAIVSYSRTIELDDPTSYALLRIGKCHEKLGNTVLALKFSARLFMKILLDKDGLRLPILCTSKNYQKALFYVNKA